MNTSDKWILPVATGALICSGTVAAITWGISVSNFHYAKWTTENISLPYYATLFKAIYNYAWILPLLTALLGILIIAKKITKGTTMACGITALVVIHVWWFFFWLLAIYLSNQSFHGSLNRG